MLVLSRSANESIMICDDIEVFVDNIYGDNTTIKIIAPKEISIHCREIYDAIQREKTREKEITTEKHTIEEDKNNRLIHKILRERDESIMIGEYIEIIIVDIRGDKIRLGITAPKEISVHKKEIYDAIQREKGEDKKENKTQQTEDSGQEPTFIESIISLPKNQSIMVGDAEVTITNIEVTILHPKNIKVQPKKN